MANTLLTLGMITKEALSLYRNQNALLRTIDTQYDGQFAQDGAKIGSTLKVRLPVDYTVRTGPTAAIQNTTENFTTITVTNQVGVDMSFSSVDLALSIDDFSARYIAPAINVIAGNVAANVMGMIEGGTGQGAVSNFIHQVDGSNNTITPTPSTWLQAGAYLDRASAPRGNGKRIAMLDPVTQARTISGMSGFFNPQDKIGKQIETGLMAKNMLGLDWYYDQTTLLHLCGSQATGTMNGAAQTGTVLTVAALTGTLNSGDIISIAGVNSVNRITKVSSKIPQQFSVQGTYAVGATAITIYPALIPPAAGVAVQYQTVDASPATNAAWTLANVASENFRKNLVYVPEALTFVTADLPLPKAGVVDSARENMDGISLRMITYYNGSTDQFSTRLDMLYGMAVLRPEWIVGVGDAI